MLMNDDLHKDDLDDFLQKNLSSYSENPPDALWAGIEAGLPAGGPAPAGGVVYTYRWWLTVAAAGLIGLFTCQHLYYRNQLDALKQQITQQNSRIVPEKSPTARKSAATEPGGAPIPGSGESSEIRQSQLPPTTPNTGIASSAGPADRLAEPRNPDPNAGLPPAGHSAQTEQQPGAPETGLSLPGRLEQTGPSTREPLVSADMPPAVSGAAMRAVEPIPGRGGLLQIPAQHPDLSVMPIPRFKTPGRWSIEAHTALLAQRNRITAQKTVPAPGGFKTFREDRSSQGTSWYSGINLGRRINRHFSLQSGLNYQYTTLSASHQAKLQFGDRDNDPHHGHGGPPPKDHDHDFTYQLNTSSGQLEVSFRVTEVDSTIHIPDQEDIELAISRREDMQFLSIPLLAKFDAGRNRIRFHLKGGVLADILVKRQNAITDIQCLNPRLMIEQNVPPKASNSGLKAVSLSYLASAGVDIGITPSLSLELEPVLIGGLTARQKDTNISASRTAAGLNVGLCMKF